MAPTDARAIVDAVASAFQSGSTDFATAQRQLATAIRLAPTLADGLSGCAWNGDELVAAQYTTLPAGSARPTTYGGFSLRVMSPDDPTFAAGKLTDPPYCNFEPKPHQCFGPTQAQNAKMGFALLIPGICLACWPCAAAFWLYRKSQLHYRHMW